MDTQEKIVCAAVRFAIAKEDYKGVKVVSGVDYESIYNDGVLGYLAREQYTNIWQNGFITDKNRFVDAKEAMRIAIAQCQIYSVELLYRELNTHNASPRYDNWQLHHDQIKAGIALMKSSLLARELKPEDLY